MKRVVFAISSLHGGGAERVVSVWASALAERGYNVSVLVYSRLKDEYPVSDKVKIYPIASSATECNDISIFERLKRFRKALKELKPNVVISFLPIVQIYVALASLGLRIPRVETIRINPWRAEILKSGYSKLWLWCFESGKALILQSEDQKDFFKKAVQKKAVVIPNPINHKYIDNGKPSYNSKSHNIVAAGRLTEQKNYTMMIDAIKIVAQEYNDILLEIYGSGNLEDDLRRYITKQELQNNVKLMGRSNELYNVYKNADMYLMSSDYEGMPNALAEAMACGLPCISTDCKTGPRDLIDDGESGFLVECGDVTGLARKIKSVFSMSDDELMIIGQRARKKVIDLCGETNSLNKLIALIESV